ncbi:MAG: T9SS type A sorting domain-containing protein, partial [Prevotella sp.]|nr:T9SS type A sorting domain-containing protein [Prevotella sp.]
GGELTVKFTKDMAVAATGDVLMTRSTASHTPTLRITAMRNGMTSSALVACRDNANSGFKHGEDAEALFDSHLADAPTLFTMSGDKATAINVRKSLNGVPLGIESNDDSAVSLTFNGVENFSEELYLYDLLEDKSTPIISSGSTVSISGKTVGRYYLVTSDLSGGSIATTPVISIDGKNVSIVSPAEDMTSITVNDVAGRRVYSDVNVGNSTEFELHQGIYIINVETAKQQVKEKILIK